LDDDSYINFYTQLVKNFKNELIAQKNVSVTVTLLLICALGF